MLSPTGTEFQHRVWAQLRRIGYGETASYGEVARALGLTNAASRAVGLANGRNPIPVVVPCHRVVGADGSLTGFAGAPPMGRIFIPAPVRGTCRTWPDRPSRRRLCGA